MTKNECKVRTESKVMHVGNVHYLLNELYSKLITNSLKKDWMSSAEFSYKMNFINQVDPTYYQQINWS